MKKLVDSTDRGPLDYALFGAVFWGFILGLAGVIMTTPELAIFGLALIGIGLAYFLVKTLRTRPD